MFVATDINYYTALQTITINCKLHFTAQKRMTINPVVNTKHTCLKKYPTVTQHTDIHTISTLLITG